MVRIGMDDNMDIEGAKNTRLIVAGKGLVWG